MDNPLQAIADQVSMLLRGGELVEDATCTACGKRGVARKIVTYGERYPTTAPMYFLGEECNCTGFDVVRALALKIEEHRGTIKEREEQVVALAERVALEKSRADAALDDEVEAQRQQTDAEERAAAAAGLVEKLQRELAARERVVERSTLLSGLRRIARGVRAFREAVK